MSDTDAGKERLLDAIGIPRFRIEKIVCPDCYSVIDGEIAYRPGDPWECYTAECPCGRLILESEWCPA